jgi:hypothetical protein
VLAAAFASAAAAPPNPNPAPPGNLTNTTWGGLGSQAGAAAAGGNITNASLYAMQQTWKWCGFYGDIYANLTLKDAANNTFYYWKVLNVSGAVIATQNSAPTWVNTQATPLTGKEVDAVFFSGDTGSGDNATQTFNTTSWGGTVHVAITSGTASAGVQTFGAGPWYTEAINISAANAVNSTTGFVGNINHGGTLFNGGTGDYQILVPARNPTLSFAWIYYFYVSLYPA